MKRAVLKTLAILVGSALAGYFLLVIAFSLPTSSIQSHVSRSASSFNDAYATLAQGRRTTQLDGSTDSLMLMTAGDSFDHNPFTSSIYAYHPTNDAKDGPYQVIADLNNPTNYQEQYSRYWHGYLLFLKPLLIVFDYSQIQIIISFIVVALIVAVAYLMSKRKLDKYIIPYVLAACLMSPATISFSMQYISIFAIANLSVITILLFFDKLQKSKNFFFLFLIIGIVACFFDFLTYPIVALGFPLLIWMILANEQKKESAKNNIKQLAIGSAAWGIGYFGIWVEKWILGSIITGENLFKAAIESTSTRLSSNSLSGDVSRFEAILRSIKTICPKPVLFIFALIAIVLIILFILKKIKISREKAISNLWILLVGILPIAWYIALANHSSIHMFFTFRTITVLFFAIFCYIASIIDITKKSQRKRRK